MPLPSLYVNGQDIEALGFRVRTAKGPWDLPEITDPTQQIPGRMGVARTGEATQIATRTIAITASVFSAVGPRTNADVLAKIEVLKPLFAYGLLEVRMATQPTRVYIARAATFETTFTGGAFEAGSADVALTLACTDPLAYELEPRCVGFAGSPVAVALGTAPTGGLIRIMGPATNPVLTYRNSGGDPVHTIGLTRALLSTDYEEIDLDLMTVTRVQSGVASNDIAALSSGDLEGFALSPEDGDPIGGVSPTIECAGLTTGGNCELLYSRSYL